MITIKMIVIFRKRLLCQSPFLGFYNKLAMVPKMNHLGWGEGGEA